MVAFLALLQPPRPGYTMPHRKGGFLMGLLELLFVVVVGLLILSLVIKAIPSIIKIVLICIAIGLVIRFAVVVLGGM